MTTEPFIPHADSIQTAWVLICQQSRIATQPPVEELEAEFDRFIARVRQEAAREALAQEPTDAEVEAAKAVLDSVEYADEPQSIRAALSAARAARRDEEKRDG